MVPDPRELRLDSLGTWLEFWTALVVIGLFLEYRDEFTKLIRARIDWSTLSRCWRLDWKRAQSVIGGILVTLGVAGELYVQAGISIFSRDFKVAPILRGGSQTRSSAAALDTAPARIARCGALDLLPNCRPAQVKPPSTVDPPHCSNWLN